MAGPGHSVIARQATHGSLRFRNGGTFTLGQRPPSPYPTASGFRVEPVSLAGGVEVEWWSAHLGYLPLFHCWDHPENGSGERLDGMPVGTAESKYLAMEQGWCLEVWTDGLFVYVHFGDDEFVVQTWYRVFIDEFKAAWADGLAKARAASASPLGPSNRQQRKARRKQKPASPAR